MLERVTGLPFRMAVSTAKLAAFVAAVAEEDQVKMGAMMAAGMLTQGWDFDRNDIQAIK